MHHHSRERFPAASFNLIFDLLPSGSVAFAPHKSTGFSLEKSKWEATRFDVSERRYLVQEIPERDGMMKRKINFVVRAFGEEREKFECYRSPDSDRVICGGLGRGMIVDTKSLRYQELYGFGYLEGDDKPGNTPALTIGSCTKID